MTFKPSLKLYLIPFLHQTTTSNCNIIFSLALYLIPFLHQTTTIKRQSFSVSSCILFHFYIKPQLVTLVLLLLCVVSYSISTSNHNVSGRVCTPFRVVSYSISTSNHNYISNVHCNEPVVSYSISTSNHNKAPQEVIKALVVSYSISTSNHNVVTAPKQKHMLYLIPFLHQTTTQCV